MQSINFPGRVAGLKVLPPHGAWVIEATSWRERCQLLSLRSYDNNLHVEGLLPAKLCLFTLLSSEQCSLFERFRLQQVQMINKTSNFQTKLMAIMPRGEELTAVPFDV